MSQMTETQYVESRLDDQIEYFDRRSGQHQTRYKRIKVVETAAAASVPVLVAVGQEAGAALAGALVTVIAGVLLIYKFEETWISYRATWSALEREKMLHATRVEPYHDRSTRFARLVQRVEALLSSESQAWLELRSPESEEE